MYTTSCSIPPLATILGIAEYSLLYPIIKGTYLPGTPFVIEKKCPTSESADTSKEGSVASSDTVQCFFRQSEIHIYSNVYLYRTSSTSKGT